MLPTIIAHALYDNNFAIMVYVTSFLVFHTKVSVNIDLKEVVKMVTSRNELERVVVLKTVPKP